MACGTAAVTVCAWKEKRKEKESSEKRNSVPDLDWENLPFGGLKATKYSALDFAATKIVFSLVESGNPIQNVNTISGEHCSSPICEQNEAD
jgi:hypothetical protein